jgi:hypothetical protein
MKIKIHLLIVLFTIVGAKTGLSQDIKPAYYWDFDQISDGKAKERIKESSDTIEGNHTIVQGVKGAALRLDGFTSVIRNQGRTEAISEGSLSAEAWLALGAYPWNWCPVVAQTKAVVGGKDASGGYSLSIGPRGELGFRIFIEGNEVLCVSETFAIPLFTWVHIAASYHEGSGLSIYIDGKQASEYRIVGEANFAKKSEIRIGMNYHPVNPSNLIGEAGYKPFWYSIDGIIDEVKIYNASLDEAYFSSAFAEHTPASKPDLPERHLPIVQSDGKSFGAYYTKLKYYKEWDQLWPVAADPDIVVTFKDSPVKLIFWRGTRYSPAWVTDNGLWMCDQSVESWNGEEGCLEHMQDRHCRYSHVRLIEDSEARKVIHWRYAPVSAYNELWNEDPKTGWAVWIDEYYYIYPDASGIRKVSWKTGAVGRPVQFQETLPLTGPGQTRRDVMEVDYLKIANLAGETLQLKYRANPQKIDEKVIPEAPNIQQHNFRSKYDPFIIFEPGNRMHYIMDRDINNLDHPGSCNHWPVAQPNCDGRVTQAYDRPAHFLGFPISNPIRHDDKGGRSHHCSVYGMNDLPFAELVELGKSWVNAPELNPKGNKTLAASYDRSQKAFVISSSEGEINQLQARIGCSDESPLFNPAIVIEAWAKDAPTVMLNGKQLGHDEFSYGFDRDLNIKNLIIWIPLKTSRTVDLQIK